jgi:tRNA(Ile)-lysidine synthetase-like protein
MSLPKQTSFVLVRKKNIVIHVQGKIPRTVFVAFSGGVDSVAAVDFLQRNHTVVLAHINHANEISSAEQTFVEQFAQQRGLAVLLQHGDLNKPRGCSWEEHWRIERYRFLHAINAPVITCHHLDDCVETWLWNMCNGRDQTIAYRNANVIRPFRTTRKSKLVDWCQRKQITWYEDATNANPQFAVRNYIRHVLVPAAMQVNPGIHTTIRNKIVNECVQ